jgi:hypothetical protein
MLRLLPPSISTFVRHALSDNGVDDKREMARTGGMLRVVLAAKGDGDL